MITHFDETPCNSLDVLVVLPVAPRDPAAMAASAFHPQSWPIAT